MNPRVASVEAMNGVKLKLSFENNETKVFDLNTSPTFRHSLKKDRTCKGGFHIRPPLRQR